MGLEEQRGTHRQRRKKSNRSPDSPMSCCRPAFVFSSRASFVRLRSHPLLTPPLPTPPLPMPPLLRSLPLLTPPLPTPPLPITGWRIGGQTALGGREPQTDHFVAAAGNSTDVSVVKVGAMLAWACVGRSRPNLRTN